MTDAQILEGLTDVEAVACTLMGEAVGDSKDGSSVEERIAVGVVIRNRAKVAGYGGPTLKGVCLRPKQFSCWNEGDPNRARLLAYGQKLIERRGNLQALDNSDAYLVETYIIAVGIEQDGYLDRVHGANHYLTESLFTSAPPSWAKGRTPIAKVGSHVFFKL